jgi:hypothetical protein
VGEFMTLEEVLDCAEGVFRNNGFKNVFKKQIELEERRCNRVLIATSNLGTNLRYADVVYSVCHVGGDEHLEIFRFDVEVDGPAVTEHFLRLCEYVSLIAPYLLLGALWVVRGECNVRIHLSYDAVVNPDLGEAFVRSLVSFVLSALSADLVLLAGRFFEIAVGSFEILENEGLFKEDLERLGCFRN